MNVWIVVAIVAALLIGGILWYNYQQQQNQGLGGLINQFSGGFGGGSGGGF